MKKDVKQEILRVTTQLFAQRGYNSVSTQNIADALGISKGNLTYHYSRKEDIVVAIVEEMHTHYTKPHIPTTLEALSNFFENAQSVIERNAFYFWHYTQFSQLSERVRDIQNEVIDDQYELLWKSFVLLRADGIMRNEEYEGQYELIVGNLSLLLIFWTPHRDLRVHSNSNTTFLDSVWAIVYPLLTDQGKEVYKALPSTESNG